ncbi:hypothetical protein ACIRF8_27105 [Streptomyces sp. NPDC102406]|uniref:hypothetical protein n=1 Tax=Streptomyces sp. NPDC102406 TaxID=3366171 RepID=UPI0037FCFECD
MTTKTDAQPDAVERKENEEAVEATDQPTEVEVEAEADVEQAEEDAATAPRPAGAGQGAGAIVSAGLGVIALSGSWLGTVASARESLIGQLNTAQSASVAKQVSEVYGDSWHAAALVGGAFSLLALLVGAFVLVKPAFGVPGRAQATWIKSAAWAGVSLGVLGLLLAAAKYTDLLLGLPRTS